MANYSQAQKQQYRLTLKNKRKYNNDTIRNLKGTNQTKIIIIIIITTIIIKIDLKEIIR
jgi:hypothetical protein